MVKLIKLLEQSILMEGRIEDVLKQYQGKVTPEVVNQFAKAQDEIDPKINNKYLDWMVKEYTKGSPANNIIQAVGKWHSNLAKMSPDVIADALVYYERTESDQAAIEKNPKDINSYGSLKNLNDVAEALATKMSSSELDKMVKGSTRIIYDTDHFRIVVPLSHKSACKYGAGTRWCVASKVTDDHFRSTTASNILFFIIDKHQPNNIGNPLYKIAVSMNKQGGKVSVWNAPDTNIGSDLKNFFPSDMIDAMNNYRKRYVVDFNKLTTTINAKLSMLGLNVDGWQMTQDNNKTFMVKMPYRIQLSADLQDKEINTTLFINSQNTGDATIKIPDTLIKDIEDIYVEHNSDENMLNNWLGELAQTIEMSWPAVLTRFQPVMSAIEAHQLISKQINKYSGNWKFTADALPTDSNRKAIFKSVRTLPVEGKDYTYTLYVILDFNKNQFTFKAEEDRGRDGREEYEDLNNPFDKALLGDTSALVQSFLEWTKEMLMAVYDENWTSWETTVDKKALKAITGTYNSKTSGTFRVEVDNDNQIHVYSDRTGGHYLITNVKAFQDNIVAKYGLKKTK